MRKRKYLIGATLGVLGALVFSGTALAGVPSSQTLQTTLASSKQDKKAFGGVSLHNVIATTYSDFNGSPPAKETLFSFGKDIKFVNGNTRPCSLAALNAATTTAAVNVSCPGSIVGNGTDEVNNKTGLFPNPNPVVLVSGGPTTLYVWTRINNALTLVLTGAYSTKAHTLDVTGLPFTLGTDLTLFDTTDVQEEDGQELVLRDGSLWQEEEVGGQRDNHVLQHVGWKR